MTTAVSVNEVGFSAERRDAFIAGLAVLALSSQGLEVVAKLFIL